MSCSLSRLARITASSRASIVVLAGQCWQASILPDRAARQEFRPRGGGVSLTDRMSYAELISRCRDESLRLLRANAAPLGLRAATPGGLAQRRGYHRIFTRDAAICALGIA